MAVPTKKMKLGEAAYGATPDASQHISPVIGGDDF